MNRQVRATLSLYLDAAKTATQCFLKNSIIIPAAIVAYLIVFLFIVRLIAPFGFAGGLVMGLVMAALVTIFYGWIYRIIRRERLSVEDLWHLDYSLFVCIINTGFVLWIAGMLISMISASSGNGTLRFLFQLGIVFLCNPLPEVLYQQRFSGFDAITEAFSFMKLFWIEWFLPFLIVCAPFIIISPQGFLFRFGQGTELLPSAILIDLGGLLIPVPLIGELLGLCFVLWFTLFRGVLFQELASGGLRRRIMGL